jgi:signal transduction histidine kinase
VPGSSSGEIGVLVAAFNDMLAEIGRRSHALQEANTTLEHEMQVRQRAEEALIAADHRKDEFLATLAHELRNPLAPIRTGIDILRMRQRRCAGQRQRATDIMDRQLRQMVRLVDDLLDVSRINTGKFAIKPGRVELKAVVNDALEVVRPFIDLHGHDAGARPAGPAHFPAGRCHAPGARCCRTCSIMRPSTPTAAACVNLKASAEGAVAGAARCR